METLKSDLIAKQSAYTLKKPKTSYGRYIEKEQEKDDLI